MNRLKIKHALLDSGLTMRALADQTGIRYDRMVKLVNNYREPTPHEHQRMANALGFDPMDLS